METQQIVIALILGLIVLGVVSLLVFPKLSRVDNDYDNFINDTLEQNFSPPNLGNLYISENLILNKYYDYSPV